MFEHTSGNTADDGYLVVPKMARSPINYKVWWNSCETRKIVWSIKLAGFAVGVVGGFMTRNPVTEEEGFVVMLAVAVIALMGDYIDYVEGKSETDSTWVRHQFCLLSMGPQ